MPPNPPNGNEMKSSKDQAAKFDQFAAGMTDEQKALLMEHLAATALGPFGSAPSLSQANPPGAFGQPNGGFGQSRAPSQRNGGLGGGATFTSPSLAPASDGFASFGAGSGEAAAPAPATVAAGEEAASVGPPARAKDDTKEQEEDENAPNGGTSEI